MSIFFQAIAWQFVDVPRVILGAWKNFLWFNLNYFSVPILLKTYFSPWHKYRYSYGKIFEVWANIETFVFNVMSRVIGVMLRTFFIILGVIIEIAVLIIGLIVLITWLLLPILLLIGLVLGVNLLL